MIRRSRTKKKERRLPTRDFKHNMAKGDRKEKKETAPRPVAAKTVQELLAPLGEIDFEGCNGGIDEEWARVKKAFFKR